MKRLTAFLLGVWEFKSAMTTSPDNSLIDDYDRGRELAHVLTLRKFEQ